MNESDLTRNAAMLHGSLSKRGYCRWWHSFCGVQKETGAVRTFFVEFYILNPGLGGSQPILGQHPYCRKKGLKPSYVCIKAGVLPDGEGNSGRQFHAFYPIEALKATPSPLVMQVGDCFYSEERIYGFVDVSREEARHKSLMSDAGSMEWDLEVHKAVACHTGFLSGAFLQFFNALDSYWHGEGIKSFFRGTVILNGVSYEVEPETSNGYADKHWGRNFNRPWIQIGCGSLTSEKNNRVLKHSCLAVNGCCPRFLFLPLKRKLLLQLTYMGEDFEFGISPFLLSRCKWETKETNRRYIWHIIARNKNAVIKISCSCTREELMQMQYENPEGIKSRRPLLAGGNGVGTIQLYRRTPGGRELLDTLHMENTFCEYQA